jgi:hypothetical protein
MPAGVMDRHPAGGPIARPVAVAAVAVAWIAGALPLLFSTRSCTRASDAVGEGRNTGDCEMSEIKSQMISRREAFSFLGLAAALGFAAPTTVLMTSDAEAQAQPTAPAPSAPSASGGTSGMQRRHERRTGRHERRKTRRTGRHERREKRRGGGEATEKK